MSENLKQSKSKLEKFAREKIPALQIEFIDGSDGLTALDGSWIKVGIDYGVAGFIHELTHAFLITTEKRLGHDGVFADTFTKFMNEYLDITKD